MTLRRIARCIFFVAIAQAVGIAGTYFTADAIPTWYATLAKSSFSPPNWVFGPVWALLYTLMGIAAAIAWELRTRRTSASRALNWYWTQLFLNAIWTPIFFGVENIGLAFVVIVLLWLALVMAVREFWKTDWRLGALLVPYLAWVSFAALLNYSIWMLN